MNSAATSPVAPVEAPPAQKWPLGKYLLFYALAALVVLGCIFGTPPAKVSKAGVEMHLPETALGFSGKNQPISEGERVLLPSDTEIVKKLYTNPQGELMYFQIVLSGVDRRSIHRPEICLTGQGWQVRSGEVIPVKLQSGHTLSVMVLDIFRPGRNSSKEGEVEALYAYWFVSADAQTPYHFQRIARTSLDLLLHNKAHRWAYVIAMAPILQGHIPNGKNREETLQLVKDFIRETIPSFQLSEMTAR